MPIFVFAQEKDANLWLGAGLSKDLSKKVSVSLEEGLRIKNNVRTLDQVFTDIGIKYDLSKWLKIAAGYKFSQKHSQGEPISLGNRYNLDLILRHKTDFYTLGFRSRYQSTYSDIFVSENWQLPKSSVRNKLQFDYVIINTPYRPSCYVEIYNDIKNRKFTLPVKYRLNIGMTYLINKEQAIDIFYMLEQEVNVSYPVSNHIMGINWSLEL